MKTKYLFIAALGTLILASCVSDEFVGNSPNAGPEANNDGAILFGLNVPNMTRAGGELTGATAAEKLGNMFVVEGTKGSEQTNSPSTTVVFDNYLVGYTANTAGTTKSNTHNWEYVGNEAGITGKMTSATWTALHDNTTDAQVQSIKYWDYSTSQYDFIAWSTGRREAVTVAPTSGSTVQVTRIKTGTTLATNGFEMTAASADDLLECYYTDINTVLKANYGAPVTLTFKNMAAKVRVALYETVPGYSVKDVQFYQAEASDPTNPNDLATDISLNPATLFTTGSYKLPKSGTVTVMYPRIGSTYRDASPKPVDYNKASVSVTAGATTDTKQEFGTLSNFATTKESAHIADGDYLGRTLPEATYAGAKGDNYYFPVVPNTNGYPLTLRVNYTLVSTDGSDEEIHVYGAKAVVPPAYTVWKSNYAYTYIFKISDNTNGWTDTGHTKAGLFPITFDALVANFTDVNAEQTTVTTVATPSITTYQQGHDHENKDEYSNSQKAGANTTDVKDLYVRVMDNSGATPTPKTNLGNTNSLLFLVSKDNASEAEVMDALKNRTSAYTGGGNIVGRNNITLTPDVTNISNIVTSIVNGVDDQPITVDANSTAKIDIDALTANKTYAYVYATTVPSQDEKVYHVAAGVTDVTSAQNYYEVAPGSIGTTAKAAGDKAAANKVYFVKNVDAENNFVSWTFKQTKVNDDVEGLYEASIPADKATTYTAGNFYFDVYYQNNGEYAVKVIKVVP